MMTLGQLRSSGLAVSFLVGTALGVVSLIGSASAGEERRGPEVSSALERYFEQKVRPLLAENCYSCHGGKKQKGGLRLDSREAILKGGDAGPAVLPGKPDESLLVEAIHYQGLKMPPSGQLAPEKIAVLTRWVSLGSPWPSRAHRADTGSTSVQFGEPLLADSRRALWSLEPVRRPAVPERVKPGLSARSQNPIDRFVQKALLEHGLTPAAEASKLVLIRRVTFDLTGLPPTPEEVDAFMANNAPDAYERLIDRLLASPYYGQRWGRHWLDLVRYADSDGYRQDALRPQAWRYRDYVVRAFNTGKPYDRFVTEQLAGDELDPADPELRVAAGFLRLGTYEYNQRDVRGQWADILNDITDTTGEVFLGLSIGCARCHDHKFDPIPQEDYYRLQAFFTPLLFRDDLTLARSREWADYQSRHAAWEKAASGVLRELAAVERPYRDRGTATAIAKFPEEIQAILHKPEKDRTPLERQLGVLAYRQIKFEHDQVPALIKGQTKTRWQKLRKALGKFDSLLADEPAPVLTATDVGPVSPPTSIAGNRKQAAIEPGFLSALDPGAARIERPKKAPRSTGRRLALARWLCRPDNPLSARVIVNRVWQYHFGRGLTATSSDFGRLGEPPSHPELLDWLASEFVAGGWRLKPLHRLIVLSATYRQTSKRNQHDLAAARQIDPANRLLWKRTIERLDAEEIRDAMLFATGELALTIGGPSVPIKAPRRTIDCRVLRNVPDSLLHAFDAPDGNSMTPRRVATTTATQALLLFNGDWALARARAFAARLQRLEPASADNADRVVLAYRLAFGRHPEQDELEQAVAFLERQARQAQASSGRSGVAAGQTALVDFCHVLLNSNEFLYVD
jgi:Protein of unknown function (DUF1549)/Protein of unknown function (DUF1553)/Planctomycete cytochrome C